MFVFGLTGGMGCGKSTVASMFAEHDIPVFDADAIGRNILDQDTPEADLVKTRFPKCMTPSGSIDRRAVAAEVFSNKESRHWLEDLMHPTISRKIARSLEKLNRPSRSLVVLEGAVLLESRTRFNLSGIIMVSTPLDLRMQRVKKRDGLSKTEIEARIQSQLPEWEKVLKSDYIIDNAGSLEYTREQVENILPLMARQMGGVL